MDVTTSMQLDGLEDGLGLQQQHPPAFQLDFDVERLFQQGSVDADFDKILGELDLELATDTTSAVVANVMAPPASASAAAAAPGAGAAAGAAGGLRELFGLQQPVPQQVPQGELQQLLQQQQQLLLQQQQQQMQQMQQQQAGIGGVVYHLPTPFQQPVTALMPAGMQQQQQQQQLLQQQLQLQLQQQQMLLANGYEAASMPMFMFSALPPMPAQQQLQAGVEAPAGMYAWPGYAPMPGVPAAAAAAPATSPSGKQANRRGRGGRASAPAAPGAEKPKGPSQRFRERQKATISSLEAEVTQKLAELSVLSEENEMLKLRSAVLEAVSSGREYHLKVIKEHGPPTFELEGSSPHSSGPLPACPVAAQGSGSSGKAPLNPSGSDSPRSGSVSSCNTGGAAAAAAAAASAGAPSAVARADSDDAAAAADLPAACAPDPLQCGVQQQGCTADMQTRSIRCIRQMSGAEIVMHWRQFLQDVSEELLNSDDKQEQQRLANGQLGLWGTGCASAAAGAAGDATVGSGGSGGSGSSVQANSSSFSMRQQQLAQQDAAEAESDDSAAFTMSKECRWCGCTNLDGLPLGSSCCGTAAAAAAQDQQQGAGSGGGAAPPAAPAGSDAPAAAAAAAGGASSSDERLVQLVNRYSYMTKFVALLNPGVLYSLFGRNLDTGEAAVYTDQHWRNVVARLHLTKHQVTYILACAELYFSSLSTIMQERQALQQALVQADGGLSECQRRLLGIDGTVDQLTLLDRLTSNLKKEHVLRIMLNCFFWGRMLTAVQFAKTAVYSHPFFPDVHAMVCVLYEDHSRDSQHHEVFPHRIAAAKAALANSSKAACAGGSSGAGAGGAGGASRAAFA